MINSKDEPLISHISELRSRIIITILALVAFFLIGFALSSQIIFQINSDLLPPGVKLVALSPIEFFYAQLRVAFILSIIFSSPILLYHLFAFARPAMKKDEKKIFWIILPVFILLLVGGICFCYFVFLKFALTFLANMAVSGGVTNLWSINQFLGFSLWTCLGTGIAFETPLVVFLLAKLGIVSARQLSKARAYVYVLILLFAGIITPSPDMIEQLLVGVPMIILFEIGVLVTRVFVK